MPPDRDRNLHSGRRFVLLAVATLLVAWGSIYLVFRGWRRRYRELAAFGHREVSAAVDPLARVVPPDLDPKEWAEMVASSHAMLDGLVGANLLDRDGLISLRDDLVRRIASARAESAEATLIRLWADMEAKAGPSLSHQARPRRIDLAITIEPLRKARPNGIKNFEWDRAVSETEAALISLSSRLDADQRSAIRDHWAWLIARNPSIEALRRVWDDLESPALAIKSARPRLAR